MGNSWGFPWILSITSRKYGILHTLRLFSGNFVGGAPFIIVGMVWIFSWEYERNSSDLYAMFHGFDVSYR